MKIRSTLVLSLLLIFSNNISVNANDLDNLFKDVKNHWAKNQITSFYNEGHINGYEDGSFRPDNYMTRAEFVKTFNKVFGLTNKSGKVFDDTKGHWAKNEIDIAVTNGIAKGISESKFEPDRKITRQEMCVMIANYLNISDKNHDMLDKFNDKPASWSADAVEAILEKGIMNGYEGNYFKPQAYSTRAEVVTTLSRINLETDSEKPNTDGGNESQKPSTGGGNESENTPVIDQEKVTKVFNLIEKIDETITLEDESSLNKIEKNLESIQAQYNALNKDEKAKVTNYKKLQTSKEKAKEIKNKLDVVYDAIAVIPEDITERNLIEARKAVVVADRSYNALDDEHKPGVRPSERSIIEGSKEQIRLIEEKIAKEEAIEAEEAKSAEKVANVINLIEEIDETITLKDENSLGNIEKELESIQAEYNALNADEKAKVTNYKKLETAQEKAEEVKNKLDVVYDVIAAIPEDITERNLIEARRAVAVADKSYNALEEEYKNGVKSSERSRIEGSKTQIRLIEEKIEKEEAESAKKVANVIALINGINDDLTYNDYWTIRDIQKEYDSLKSYEKELVNNYQKLVSAKAKVDAIVKEVHKVIELIYNIPADINRENLDEAKEAVRIAEEAYEALPEESKEHGISKYDYTVLISSKQIIERLEYAIEYEHDSEVIAIQKAIDALPKLEFKVYEDYEQVKEWDEQITSVIDEYFRIGNKAHAIKNKEKLDDAYSKIRYIKAKIIDREIINVIEGNNIYDIKEYEKALRALEKAYWDLEDKIGQNLVENYGYLITAIARLSMIR